MLWIEGERCLRTYANDLKTYTTINELGFWEVRSHVGSHTSFCNIFVDGFNTLFVQDPL
jgi:hypothetical protein